MSFHLIVFPHTFLIQFSRCLFFLYLFRNRCQKTILCFLISVSDLWWAQVDSNHRPHAYQACALTTWAMRPLWWRWGGSNSWPPACKAGALPAELHPHKAEPWAYRSKLFFKASLDGSVTRLPQKIFFPLAEPFYRSFLIFSRSQVSSEPSKLNNDFHCPCWLEDTLNLKLNCSP